MFFCCGPFLLVPCVVGSLETFLLSAPGVQSVFFCCAPLGAATFRRGQSKKNTTQGVFFWLRPRRKAREGEAPLGAGHGARAKKNTTQGDFFCCGPEAPLGAGTGPEQKKNTTQGVFFLAPTPGERQGKEKPRWAPARGQSRCLFFALAPNGASPSLAFRRGRSKKKKTLGGVFFLLWAPCRHGASPSPAFPRGRSKKKGPWVVFFFCCGPAWTLTHSLRAGWRCLPLAGVVLFLLRPRPDRGGVFFLLWPRPDAHSLTVGWGDFGKARVVFFFLLRPRRVFLDNNKKCLGYYIGSKKTRRGHSKKKHHFH